MKKVNLLLSLALVVMLSFTRCGSDDGPAPTFTLVSLTAGGIDLAGVTSAVDVPEDADIIAEFSSEIDASTATNTTITITDGDGNAATYTVSVSGSTVTLSPTKRMGWRNAILYCYRNICSWGKWRYFCRKHINVQNFRNLCSQQGQSSTPYQL